MHRSLSILLTLAFMSLNVQAQDQSSDIPTQTQSSRFSQISPPKATVYKYADIHESRLNDSISSRSMYTQGLILSHTYLKAGAQSPFHNHPEEELIVLISGRLRARTSTGDVIMEPGDVYAIESFAEHQVEALEDTYMVEVFGPGRVIQSFPPPE